MLQKLLSLIFLFQICCGCSQDNQVSSSSDNTKNDTSATDVKKRVVGRELLTTLDSLQGTWISDDNVELIGLNFVGNTQSTFNKDSVIAKDRCYIADSCIDEISLLSERQISGRYLITYSPTMQLVRSCYLIDTLNEHKLVLFSDGEGKHGIYYRYIRKK